jgi:hypothetical protein
MNKPELTYGICHVLGIRPVPAVAPAPVAA